MPIELEKGRELGSYLEFATKTDNRGFISRIPTEKLKAELYMRENWLPIAGFVKQIVETANKKGVPVSPENVVYELSYDVLGRPEFFVGYNFSGESLAQILEEDEKMDKGLMPKRERIAWTDRLVVYDGKARRYAGDEGDNVGAYIDRFVQEIRSRNKK